MTLTISKATPSVVLSTSATSINYGATVTFTATLNGPGVVPTGTVTFMSGATSLGMSTASGNTATFATDLLAAGTDSVAAVYSGDNNYISETSTAVTVTVAGTPGFTINGASIALEQNHDRYTRGQCLRVLIFQEINTLKNAFQGTFIVILL